MDEAHTFRIKPEITFKAVQWTGDNLHEIRRAFGPEGIYGPYVRVPSLLVVQTAFEGAKYVHIGDYVMADVIPKTYYPCKAHIFNATYDKVTEIWQASTSPS